MTAVEGVARTLAAAHVLTPAPPVTDSAAGQVLTFVAPVLFLAVVILLGFFNRTRV